MNRCGDCKYFGDPVMYESKDDACMDTPTGFYTCNLIKHRHADNSYGEEIVNNPAKAVIEGGGGYNEGFRVREDFGCVCFERKMVKP